MNSAFGSRPSRKASRLRLRESGWPASRACWRCRGRARDLPGRLRRVDLSPLTTPHEAGLLAKLAAYPEVLQRAQSELGPHQVAFYLRELAGELHSYYFAHKWLLDDDEPLKLARLALAVAVRQVLRNGLALIGVAAPNQM